MRQCKLTAPKTKEHAVTSVPSARRFPSWSRSDSIPRCTACEPLFSGPRAIRHDRTLLQLLRFFPSWTTQNPLEERTDSFTDHLRRLRRGKACTVVTVERSGRERGNVANTKKVARASAKRVGDASPRHQPSNGEMTRGNIESSTLYWAAVTGVDDVVVDVVVAGVVLRW